MNIKTKCMICGNKIASFVCGSCGSAVCDGCYNKNERLCLDCATASGNDY